MSTTRTHKPSRVEKLLEDFGLPPGRYEADIVGAELIDTAALKADKGKHRPKWEIELTALVQRNGAKVVSRRPLAEGEDPYALSSAQRRGLRDFAGRLQVQSTGPVEEIVAQLRALYGAEVIAYVRPSRFGLQVTLSRAEGAENVSYIEVVAGEVLDAENLIEPEYRDRTVVAQGAHEMLLNGLRHANRGLALASEACWRLRSDEGWVALGYDSVSAYLASPELSMSRSSFYSLADIWQRYVIDGGVDEQRLVAPSKLEVPLAALRAGDVTAQEALADAEMLGLRDLREKYRGDSDDGKTQEKKSSSGHPEFPFMCPACAVVIESAEEVSADGILYQGFRWPEGWDARMINSAISAAEAVS